MQEYKWKEDDNRFRSEHGLLPKMILRANIRKGKLLWRNLRQAVITCVRTHRVLFGRTVVLVVINTLTIRQEPIFSMVSTTSALIGDSRMISVLSKTSNKARVRDKKERRDARGADWDFFACATRPKNLSRDRNSLYWTNNAVKYFEQTMIENGLCNRLLSDTPSSNECNMLTFLHVHKYLSY
jgi:hypothetical protein